MGVNKILSRFICEQLMLFVWYCEWPVYGKKYTHLNLLAKRAQCRTYLARVVSCVLSESMARHFMVSHSIKTSNNTFLRLQ